MYESLSSGVKGCRASQDGIPTLNGKKMCFVQYDKNCCCGTHGYKCIKGHDSKICTNPGANHNKQVTRQDTKNGETKNKDWVCSYYKEKGFWVHGDCRLLIKQDEVFKNTKITNDLCNDTTHALSVTPSCRLHPTSKNNLAITNSGTTSTFTISSAPAININTKVPPVAVRVANGQ